MTKTIKLLTKNQLEEFKEWMKIHKDKESPNNMSYYHWFMKEKGIVIVK